MPGVRRGCRGIADADPRLIGVAEDAAALAGRDPELAEHLGLLELVVAHFLGDGIDEADTLVQVVVALPALLVHAAEHEFDARLRRKIIRRGGARQENQQRDAEPSQHPAMLRRWSTTHQTRTIFAT